MEGKGWEDFKPLPSDKGRPMLVGEHEVYRGEIPSYFTPENIEAINLFWSYKNFGLPYAGGWAEQPAKIVDILETLEKEYQKIMELKHGKRKS